MSSPDSLQYFFLHIMKYITVHIENEDLGAAITKQYGKCDTFSEILDYVRQHDEMKSDLNIMHKDLYNLYTSETLEPSETLKDFFPAHPLVKGKVPDLWLGLRLPKEKEDLYIQSYPIRNL